MTSTSTPKIVRVTVPVASDVLEVFKRLAKAGNMSTGRAMAEWLADTVEGAELMAHTMERARAAPKLVTAELHAMALGMADETGELMRKFSKMGAASRSASQAKLPRSASAPIPPPSNTGGKGTKTKPSPRGSKS